MHIQIAQLQIPYALLVLMGQLQHHVLVLESSKLRNILYCGTTLGKSVCIFEKWKYTQPRGQKGGGKLKLLSSTYLTIPKALQIIGWKYDLISSFVLGKTPRYSQKAVKGELKDTSLQVNPLLWAAYFSILQSWEGFPNLIILVYDRAAVTNCVQKNYIWF